MELLSTARVPTDPGTPSKSGSRALHDPPLVKLASLISEAI